MGHKVVAALSECIVFVYDIYVRFLEETDMTGYVIIAFFLLLLIRLFIGPLVGHAISPGAGSDSAEADLVKGKMGYFSKPRSRNRR